MLREFKIAAIAAVVLTLVLGVAYPLAMTGVSQVLFPNKADGSVVTRDGKAVASHRIGQDFAKNPGYFQGRPSYTGYNPSGSAFNNQGPNQQDLADQLKGYLTAYLKRERPFTPNLTAAQVPVDAVTTSASGVDPDISEANARIQANRVARERGLPLQRVLQIVNDHASHPLFGLGGPKSINVVDVNLALDEASNR
jgi:potassium-transporting ATPase KdpC subunit